MSFLRHSLRYRRDTLVLTLIFVLMAYGYVRTVQWAKQHPPASAVDTINVAVSPLVQMILTGGDRYLAANVGAFRAMILGVEYLDQPGLAVLAKVQRDVAFLNPAHEDNYYVAQAVLPWAGDVVSANEIMAKAAIGREWDFLPLFFLGFNQMYFQQDFMAAARSMEEAAARSSGDQREGLLDLSAKFYERADDPHLALRLVKAIQASARDPALRAFLQARIVRIEGLIALQEAADRFRTREERMPVSLSELVSAQDIAAIPIDPLGSGYALAKNGVPGLVRKAPPILPKIKLKP